VPVPTPTLRAVVMMPTPARSSSRMRFSTGVRLARCQR
jgi:hypothetical protein